MATWALIIVDGGMWTDPAVYGPFATEADARAELERQGATDIEDDHDGVDVVGIVTRMASR